MLTFAKTRSLQAEAYVSTPLRESARTSLRAETRAGARKHLSFKKVASISYYNTSELENNNNNKTLS